MSRFLARLGFIPVETTRGILVLKGEAEPARQAGALVRQVRGRYPRLPALMLDADEAPEQDFAVHPYPLGWGEKRFLKRSRAKILILAGGFADLPASLIEKAAWRGCDILALVLDDAARQTLDAMSWRGRVSRILDRDLLSHPGDALIDAIEPYLVSSKRQKLGGRADQRQRRLERLRRLPILGGLLSWKFQQIGSLGDLRTQLGQPQTILCLGNGPSSEAPALDGIRYDRLFRVNESWKGRGRFIDPDLVFTSLNAVKVLRPRQGFILKTLEDEAAMQSALAFAPRLIRYGVAARLGLYDQGHFGTYSPTNGAVMLAAAVALQPAHLIVAGIDLYAHPEGAYPQDGATVNDYSVGHDRQLESDFLLDTLARFTGKLTILSPALAEAFERRQRG